MRPVIAQPVRIVVHTKVAIALHNYLGTTKTILYTPLGYVDEDGEGNPIPKGMEWMMNLLACSLCPRQVAIGLYKQNCHY